MKHWTIGRRMVIGFGALIVITLALGGYSFISLSRISTTAVAIEQDAIPGLTLIAQTQGLTREAYGLTLRFILSTSESDRSQIQQQMTDAARTIDGLFKEYEKSIVRDEDRRLFTALAPLAGEYRQTRSTRVLPLATAGKTAEAVQAAEKELLPAFNRYVEAMQAVVDNNASYSKTQSTAIMSEAASARLVAMIGALLALGVGIVVAWLIVRTTNGVLSSSVTELNQGAQQVAAASGQVSTSAQALSQGATEQAASLEETSASMEEMASMTRKNAENTVEAARHVEQAARLVGEANASLNEMVASMASIKSSSDKVAKIIKTIDEIAFQTNILALNAAVEAARAGEAGMGFAVVADEVRALAQRSAQAAKDTAALIEESIEKANEGNARVTQVAGAITAITESSSKVKSLVEEISVASRQQAQGIDQVSQAVSQMEKVTQSAAATAEESAAASEELSAQAEATLNVVAQLAALVGGTGQAAAPARAAKPAGVPATNVLRMAAKARVKGPAAAGPAAAEQQIPLEDTGTFGSF